MRTVLALLVASYGCVAAFGCGSSGDAPESTTELTGFGATTPAWNAHHEPDQRFDPGAAYDPDPAVGRGKEPDTNSRYYGVVHQRGRVVFYYMRFPAGTTEQEAKESVLASEFPKDAEVSLERLNSCAQMVVTSPHVAKETRGAAIVEFTTGEIGGERYDENDIWGAAVGLSDRFSPDECHE